MPLSNEPAFPVICSKALENYYPGLTKREYFTVMAMQGLCAAIHDYSTGTLVTEESLAKDACAIADAVLKQLETT